MLHTLPTQTTGKSSSGLPTSIQTSGPGRGRLHICPPLSPGPGEVTTRSGCSASLPHSFSAPILPFLLRFLSLLRPPHLFSPLSLPGNGPGGRVNQRPTATLQGISALLPRRCHRLAHTHGDSQSSGRLCQLRCVASSSTQAKLCGPLPGPLAGCVPVTAVPCHLQAEPRRWGYVWGSFNHLFDEYLFSN